jgi:hypothetical protein
MLRLCQQKMSVGLESKFSAETLGNFLKISYHEVSKFTFLIRDA